MIGGPFAWIRRVPGVQPNTQNPPKAQAECSLPAPTKSRALTSFSLRALVEPSTVTLPSNDHCAHSSVCARSAQRGLIGSQSPRPPGHLASGSGTPWTLPSLTGLGHLDLARLSCDVSPDTHSLSFVRAPCLLPNGLGIDISIRSRHTYISSPPGMSRYPDDPDYRRGELRQSSRREPPRRERVEPPRDRERRNPGDRMDHDIRVTEAMGTRMDNRIDSRMDPRMDSRMDIRAEQQRPNTTSRIDPRPDRVMDTRGAEPEVVLLRDPTTGEIYRELRNPPVRSPYGRDERDYDAPSRSRTAMEVPIARDREPARPEYTEYFCPGEGIEREVIQHEICKYLGQDATCRPGRNNDVCSSTDACGKCGLLTQPLRDVLDFGSRPIARSPQYDWSSLVRAFGFDADLGWAGNGTVPS